MLYVFKRYQTMTFAAGLLLTVSGLLPATASAQDIIQCWARGLYEKCVERHCRTEEVTRFGFGYSEEEAKISAQQACSGHMTQMAILSNINDSAAIISPCTVIHCEVQSGGDQNDGIERKPAKDIPECAGFIQVVCGLCGNQSAACHAAPNAQGSPQECTNVAADLQAAAQYLTPDLTEGMCDGLAIDLQ